MAELKPSREQIDALEFQTEQAFTSLKRTITTKNHQDAFWVEKLYSALGKSIDAATNYSHFSEWDRVTQKAVLFDRYILQYVVGWSSSMRLESYLKSKKYGRDESPKDSDVTEEHLKNALDDKNSYLDIQMLTHDLAESHNFDAIVNVLEYIRENYQKPN